MLKVLYLAVLSRYEDIVLEAFQLFGFKAWFYNDSVFDPILLALKIDDYTILNAISKYFDDNPDSPF